MEIFSLTLLLEACNTAHKQVGSDDCVCNTKPKNIHSGKAKKRDTVGGGVWEGEKEGNGEIESKGWSAPAAMT